jgi:hypothetical protein
MIDEALMRTRHEDRLQEIEHDRMVRGLTRATTSTLFPLHQIAAKACSHLWKRAAHRGMRLVTGGIAAWHHSADEQDGQAARRIAARRSIP